MNSVLFHAVRNVSADFTGKSIDTVFRVLSFLVTQQCLFRVKDDSTILARKNPFRLFLARVNFRRVGQLSSMNFVVLPENRRHICGESAELADEFLEVSP